MNAFKQQQSQKTQLISMLGEDSKKNPRPKEIITVSIMTEPTLFRLICSNIVEILKPSVVRHVIIAYIFGIVEAPYDI